jgi:CheY-like chemotaxis protein
VLVADDHAANRGWLTKLLAAVGFQVREAADGAEALRVWDAWRPQLILMDMRMPGMDGYEATRQIKARPGGQATRIFATTASVFEEKRQEIEDAGVDDFLGKPLKEGELFQKIQDQLGVQFAFAAEEPPPEAATGPAANPELLAKLPSSLVAQLRRALHLGDTEQLRELIRQVGRTDGPLAAALQSLADQYDFDALSRLLPQENTG